MKTSRWIRVFKNPYWVFGIVLRRLLSHFLPDSLFIKLEYFSGMGRFPNLESPQTYNEKLQWLKLNDIHPEYSILVDKFTAKQFATERVGEQYVIPTLGVWDKYEEIDFPSLPNSFVLKTTHDSGGVVICKDKMSFDFARAKKKIEKSLRRNYYFEHREYPYKEIEPRIIAEKYIGSTDAPDDYKFFCFNGKCKMLFVATGRLSGDTRFNFYDENFSPLPFTQGHPNSKSSIEKPINFDTMLYIAEVLGKGFRHVRVDLYNVEGQIYFGEMTFFHYSGNVPFEPSFWDAKIGEWLDLKDECL